MFLPSPASELALGPRKCLTLKNLLLDYYFGLSLKRKKHIKNRNLFLILSGISNNPLLRINKTKEKKYASGNLFVGINTVVPPSKAVHKFIANHILQTSRVRKNMIFFNAKCTFLASRRDQTYI